MMTNLFSTFDTSTNSMLDMNWLVIFTNIMFLPLLYWFLMSRMSQFYKIFFITMYNEFKIILSSKILMLNILFFISIMIFIAHSNIWGLLPYIFTPTSHLVFALSFTSSLWFALMLFGWLNNYNHMFAHLAPNGTPYILMPIMVIIETTSNVIRPITLAIRLTANMIAGHLLLTLLSQTSTSVSIKIIFIILSVQIILLTLEISVAFIQSYVFAILGVLYLKETV